MSRKYTRSEQRKYRDKRKAQASLVAERLIGKKKGVDPDVEDFFCSTSLKNHSLKYSLGMLNNPRSSFIISGMSGI